jgi:hypothetical protein
MARNLGEPSPLFKIVASSTLSIKERVSHVRNKRHEPSQVLQEDRRR